MTDILDPVTPEPTPEPTAAPLPQYLTRIIETAANVLARTTGISPLPQGVYYPDATLGLLIDYLVMAEGAPPGVVFAMREDGSVLQEPPADYVFQHHYAGWEYPRPAVEPVQLHTEGA